MTFTLPLFVLVALVWAFVAVLVNLYFAVHSPEDVSTTSVGVWAVYVISLIPTALYALWSLSL